MTRVTRPHVRLFCLLFMCNVLYCGLTIGRSRTRSVIDKLPVISLPLQQCAVLLDDEPHGQPAIALKNDY